MNTINWSQVNDVKSFYPIRSGTSFVCNVCCDKGRLLAGLDCVILDCPGHLRLVMRDGKVVSAKTRGLRA